MARMILQMSLECPCQQVHRVCRGRVEPSARIPRKKTHDAVKGILRTLAVIGEKSTVAAMEELSGLSGRRERCESWREAGMETRKTVAGSSDYLSQVIPTPDPMRLGAAAIPGTERPHDVVHYYIHTGHGLFGSSIIHLQTATRFAT